MSEPNETWTEIEIINWLMVEGVDIDVTKVELLGFIRELLANEGD